MIILTTILGRKVRRKRAFTRVIVAAVLYPRAAPTCVVVMCWCRSCALPSWPTPFYTPKYHGNYHPVCREINYYRYKQPHFYLSFALIMREWATHLSFGLCIFTSACKFQLGEVQSTSRIPPVHSVWLSEHFWTFRRIAFLQNYPYTDLAQSTQSGTRLSSSICGDFIAVITIDST